MCLLSALHHRTILYNQPRRRPYPENLEIESYLRYIFPAHKSPATSKWPGGPNLGAPSTIALLLNALPTPSLCPKVLGIRASTGGNRAECQVAKSRKYVRTTKVKRLHPVMHAHEMHAHEIHAREMHARKVHAREMHAREVHAHEVHAYETRL